MLADRHRDKQTDRHAHHNTPIKFLHDISSYIFSWQYECFPLKVRGFLAKHSTIIAFFRRRHHSRVKVARNPAAVSHRVQTNIIKLKAPIFPAIISVTYVSGTHLRLLTSSSQSDCERDANHDTIRREYSLANARENVHRQPTGKDWNDSTTCPVNTGAYLYGFVTDRDTVA